MYIIVNDRFPEFSPFVEFDSDNVPNMVGAVVRNIVRGFMYFNCPEVKVQYLVPGHGVFRHTGGRLCM